MAGKAPIRNISARRIVWTFRRTGRLMPMSMTQEEFIKRSQGRFQAQVWEQLRARLMCADDRIKSRNVCIRASGTRMDCQRFPSEQSTVRKCRFAHIKRLNPAAT